MPKSLAIAFLAIMCVIVPIGTPAAHAARGCGTINGPICGVGADQGHGDFHGLLAVRGVPWVLELAAHSGTQAGCGDCSWTLTLSCAANSPGDPGTQSACTGSGTSATCKPGQRLFRVYLSTDAVLDQVVGTVCIGGRQQPVPVGTDAHADVERYLRDLTPPDLDVSTEPSGATLAGLATFFTAATPATLRPVPFGNGELTETITLTPTRTNWIWGDGSRSGWLAGSSSAVHSYLRGGVARLRLGARWGATYTIGYQGETFGPYDATGQLVRVQRLALPVDTSAPALVSR